MLQHDPIFFNASWRIQCRYASINIGYILMISCKMLNFHGKKRCIYSVLRPRKNSAQVQQSVGNFATLLKL